MIHAEKYEEINSEWRMLSEMPQEKFKNMDIETFVTKLG